MRNLNPEQHDTGTRLATPSRRRPFPSATKEIGDVCTQAIAWKEMINFSDDTDYVISS